MTTLSLSGFKVVSIRCPGCDNNDWVSVPDRDAKVCRTCKVEIDGVLFKQALQHGELQKAIVQKAQQHQSLKEYAPGGKKMFPAVPFTASELGKLDKIMAELVKQHQEPLPMPEPVSEKFKVSYGSKDVYWETATTKPVAQAPPLPPAEAECEGGPLDGSRFPQGSGRMQVQWPPGAFYSWEYNPVDNTARWVYYGAEDV